MTGVQTCALPDLHTHTHAPQEVEAVVLEGGVIPVQVTRGAAVACDNTNTTGHRSHTAHRTHTGHTQVTHRSHTMMLRASHHAHGARRFLMMISVPRFQDLRGLFRVVGCRFIELVPGECPAPTHPTLCTGRTQLHESSAQVTQESCNHNHESFKHHESCRHPTAARPRAGSRTSRAVGPCESCQPTCPAIGPCESCSHTCPAIGPSEHVSIRATIHVRERDVWL